MCVSYVNTLCAAFFIKSVVKDLNTFGRPNAAEDLTDSTAEGAKLLQRLASFLSSFC